MWLYQCVYDAHFNKGSRQARLEMTITRKKTENEKHQGSYLLSTPQGCSISCIGGDFHQYFLVLYESHTQKAKQTNKGFMFGDRRRKRLARLKDLIEIGIDEPVNKQTPSSLVSTVQKLADVDLFWNLLRWDDQDVHSLCKSTRLVCVASLS